MRHTKAASTARGTDHFQSVSSTNWTWQFSAATITGSHTLDVMLYTVRLGPSVYWDLNENFGLSASFGPAIGIVSGDYKYDEIGDTLSGISAPTIRDKLERPTWFMAVM